MEELKSNIQTIKNKIAECRTNNITDPFSIEMNIMENLPELYSQYPYLIKKLLMPNSINMHNLFYYIRKFSKFGVCFIYFIN